MLLDVSKEIRNCHEHAERCRREAVGARNELARTDYLDLEKRWLALAHSYETSERIARYLQEAERYMAPPQAPQTEYRLYVYNEKGALIGPATSICAENDALAIIKARGRLDGLDAVLQEGLRVVKKFSHRT